VSVALWLGNAAPIRSIRWVDGALAAAAKLGSATAIVAGDTAWLDLASDRSTRAGVACVSVSTELKLDYLGWAQIVTAVLRELKTRTVLIDEASRPERFAEVAAVADLLDVPQVTRVVALAPDGDAVRATRTTGRELQTLRVKGPAVFGVRIAGPTVDEYATPTPTPTMHHFDLKSLGLDALVLGHRALPPRSAPAVKKTVERVTEHVAAHVMQRGR
jgi:hypothetical protein